MDPFRFDALVRAVATLQSRRSLLRRGALSLGAVVLGEEARETAAACGQCLRKRRGKCRPKPAGTMCGDGTGKCFKGNCRPMPDCQEANTNCPGPKPCCSGTCNSGACALGAKGEQCLGDLDCASGNCVAYRCT